MLCTFALCVSWGAEIAAQLYERLGQESFGCRTLQHLKISITPASSLREFAPEGGDDKTWPAAESTAPVVVAVATNTRLSAGGKQVQ